VIFGNNDDVETWFDSSHYFPGPMFSEKEDVQVVLLHLWLLLGKTLHSHFSHMQSSPLKNNIRHEKTLEGTDSWKERKVDVVVLMRGAQYARIICNDSIEVMIELKPGQ